jgi:predicted secreted hydrolase
MPIHPFISTTTLSLALFAASPPVLANGEPGADGPPTTSQRHGRNCGAHGPCSKPLTGLINLPADDAVHPYTPASFEWWYWTSHLETDEGQKFGFLDVVYTGLFEFVPGIPAPLQWSDTTISDLTEGKYHFPGRAYLPEPATVIQGGFKFDIGQNSVVGGNGRDEIHAIVDDGARRYEVDLQLKSEKAPVQHMAGGYIFDYARTRMATQGSITVDGKRHNVHGYTYFDHEWGDQLYVMATVQDWTWISMQLEDDRELVVLVLNHQDGTQMAWADLTDAHCKTTRYEPGEFTLTTTGTWQQSSTCQYPMGWQIAIPRAGMTLNVTSSIVDQDIYVPGMDHYYEGEAVVRGWDHGPVRGRAVVELTAFCGF